MNINIEGIIFELQPLGGISRIYHEVLPRICSQNEDVAINIVTAEKILQQLPSNQQIKHIQSPSWPYRYIRPARLFWGLRDFLRIETEAIKLASRKRSIWHATYFRIPKQWNGPRIVSVYDLIYERFPNLFNMPEDDNFRLQKQRAVLNADKVVCISEATRRDVVEFYKIPEAKTETIYLGYSTAFRQMPSLNAQKEKPFLLYVGMRVHYKNFSNLIKAYAKWKHKHEINLVVIGKPWDIEETKNIHGLGLGENVQIKINITDAELCRLYNDAVALVYPSLYEGFGIPLLEASACACPIIASRIPSTQEIIGSLAVYFDPLDIESMLDALEKSLNLHHDPKFIQIARNYSWDRAAKETFGLYQELL
ncbi:MAG: glycosyltransferase family 4 protein [Anaerolineales bacterium]